MFNSVHPVPGYSVFTCAAVCTGTYQQPVLGYKCLILDTQCPVTLYLRQQVREFCSESKGLANSAVDGILWEGELSIE